MSIFTINRVVLVGRLTRDAETRSLPSGSTVCSLRIACNGESGATTTATTASGRTTSMSASSGPPATPSPLHPKGQPRRHRRPLGVARVGDRGPGAPTGCQHRRRRVSFSTCRRRQPEAGAGGRRRRRGSGERELVGAGAERALGARRRCRRGRVTTAGVPAQGVSSSGALRAPTDARWARRVEPRASKRDASA